MKTRAAYYAARVFCFMRQIIFMPAAVIAAGYFDYQIRLDLNQAQASAGLMHGLQRPPASQAAPLIYPCYSAMGIVESGGKGEVGISPVHSA